MAQATQNPNERIAVIGGGLAGISTAWALVNAMKLPNDKVKEGQITVLEAGDEIGSYLTHYHPQDIQPIKDGKKEPYMRASGGESPYRVIRMMGADDTNRQMVEATFDLLKELQGELDNNPQKYSDIPKEHRQLFRPLASVYIAPQGGDEGYTKNLATLKGRVKELSENHQFSNNTIYSEIDGATLKGKYPGIYENIPDDAQVLVEEPYNINVNPHGVAGEINVNAMLRVMRQVMKENGVNFLYEANVSNLQESADNVALSYALGDNEPRITQFDKVVVATGQRASELLRDFDVQTTLDRVVTTTIDMRALGEELIQLGKDWNQLGETQYVAENLIRTGEKFKDITSIPFTKAAKGTVPDGTAGSLYMELSKNGNPQLKFLLGSQTKPTESAATAHAPVTPEEHGAVRDAVINRFILDDISRSILTTSSGSARMLGDKLSELLDANMKDFTCGYANGPSERQVIGKITDRVFANVNDSSGAARSSIGGGIIAMDAVSGKEPSITGSLEKFGLDAHFALRGGEAHVAANASAAALNEPEQKRARG